MSDGTDEQAPRCGTKVTLKRNILATEVQRTVFKIRFICKISKLPTKRMCIKYSQIFYCVDKAHVHTKGKYKALKDSGRYT